MQNPLSDIWYEIELLKTQLNNLIRPATVTYVYRRLGEAGFQDDRDDGKHIGFVDVVSGKIELWQIPVYTPHNEKDSVLWLPTEGEDGNIFCPSGDLANAFFISTIPTKEQPIPEPTTPSTETIKINLRQGNVIELVLKDDLGSLTNEVNQFTFEIEPRLQSFVKIKHGLSSVEITPTGLKVEFNPLVKMEMSPTGIIFTAPTVNVIGVLQVAGIPLMIP